VHAEFVSLADLLRPPRPPVAPSTLAAVAGAEAGDAKHVDAPAVIGNDAACVRIADDAADVRTTDVAADIRDADDAGDVRAVLRDARLFRARLADAFDSAATKLVRELAADVLMRELRLAPCDIAALVQRVRDRAPVVRVRVAAVDVDAVRGVPVVIDPALEAGDAMVELAGGALDARLGARLACVLETFA
jgi:hypothetical protein